LLKRADLVFTGGQSIYEAKRERHRRVYPFPSSVDVPHFCSARQGKTDPEDQAAIPHPRLGFFGVVDERMDLHLLDAIASARPEWHLVILGPCVKIDPATLPRHPNIHYLGMKKYDELPAYLSGWDVALLPFAKNESTKFISPTKTPEYLAAGCRVVSTSVRDVVRPYGEQELVYIADRPEEFIQAIERALEPPPAGWRERVDAFLSNLSWDRTWSEMSALIDGVTAALGRAPEQMTGLAVPGTTDARRPRPSSSI
jgi:UDP-galactopyranose mutase